MTDWRNGTSPQRTCSARAGSTSLRWTCRTRPRAARAISTGSVPARYTWPVSRQSDTSDESSRRSIWLPFSMAMPQCGWRAVRRPASLTIDWRRRRLARNEAPLVLVHLHRRVVSGMVRRGTEDQHLRPRRRRAGGTLVDVLEDGIDLIGAVEEGRDEPADDAQVVAGQEVTELGRIGRQVAVGTELGGGQAALDHLAHDPVPIHQVAPAWRAIHTPRDRRARYPLEKVAHEIPSARLAKGVDGQITVLVRCCAIGCTDRSEEETGMPGPGVELIGEEEIAEVMQVLPTGP